MTTPRALSGPDIIPVIVEHVWRLPLPDRQFALVNLAQVDKTFSHSAIRFLWREMTSLIPLFRLLPTLVQLEFPTPADPHQGMGGNGHGVLVMDTPRYDLVR